MKDNIFLNEIKKNKLSATYLFYSDSRVDLVSYAKRFAELVYEVQYNEKFENILKHYDVFYTGEEILKINDIREIVSESLSSTYMGKKKIIIINHLEQIDSKNLNLLLKTIEEPVKNIYFILLTNSLNILKTIKSRCIIFEIKPNKYDVEDEIYDVLDGNENAIRTYLENKEKYEINIEFEPKNYIEYIDNIFSQDIVISKMYLHKFLKYIVNNKYNLSDIYIYLYEVISRVENKRFLNEIFSKILVIDKDIDYKKYSKLITLKSSINANISIDRIFTQFILTYLED